MKYWLFTLISICSFQYGLTILCYECNSAQNSECLEKVLPSSLLRNCSDYDNAGSANKHTLCRKAVQAIELSVNSHQPSVRVIRSCGWDESKFKGVCYHRSGYGGRQDVCSCTTDYCNSGHRNSAFAMLSTPIFLIIAKLRLR